MTKESPNSCLVEKEQLQQCFTLFNRFVMMIKVVIMTLSGPI